MLMHTFQQYSNGVYGADALLLLPPLTEQFLARNIINNCSVHCNPSTAKGRKESLILVLYRSALANIRRKSNTKASSFLYNPFSNFDCTVDKSIGYLILDL